MRTVFADTAYWAAVTRPRDQWRQVALQAKKRLGDARLVTTDGVLTEVFAVLGRLRLSQKTIDALIVNSPWEEPKKRWRHDQKTRRFGRMPGAAMP